MYNCGDDESNGRSNADDEAVVEQSPESGAVQVDQATSSSVVDHEIEYFLEMSKEQASYLLHKEIRQFNVWDETSFADFLDERKIYYDGCTNVVKLMLIEAFRLFEGNTPIAHSKRLLMLTCHSYSTGW